MGLLSMFTPRSQGLTIVTEALEEKQYEVHKFSRGWVGADLVASRLSSPDASLLLIKVRDELTVDGDWYGREYHVAFPINGEWYIAEHDQLVDITTTHSDPALLSALQEGGELRCPNPTEEVVELLSDCRMSELA